MIVAGAITTMAGENNVLSLVRTTVAPTMQMLEGCRTPILLDSTQLLLLGRDEHFDVAVVAPAILSVEHQLALGLKHH